MMASPKPNQESLPNPYELTDVEAQKLGYVNFDLKTLELEDEFIIEDDIEDESDYVTQDIVNNLLETNDTFAEMKNKLNFKFISKHILNDLYKYFLYIEKRLLKPQVTYLTLCEDDDPDCHYDFASFGTRFWQFLVQCNKFSCFVLRKLSKLIYHYLKLHPQEILHFREQIVKARLHSAIDPPTVPESDQIDPLIDDAFEPIDSGELYSALKELEDAGSDAQIDHFMTKVGMSSARKDLTKVLASTIKSVFPELKPEFVQVGGGNIDYHLLHYQLSFGIPKILDRSTLSLVMTPVLRVMEKMGLYGEPEDSLRSVEFDIDGDEDDCDEAEEDDCDEEDDYSDDEDNEDEEEDDDDLPSRKLIISISSESSAFCKLVNFYAQHDTRFSQMVLLLKYYFAQSNLFYGDSDENEPFIWLIIWFLQRTKSPVLPTLNTLKLTKKKSFDDLVDFCPVPNSTPNSCPSIGELVVEFIDWFSQFDFGSFLNPCDGSFSKNYSKYSDSMKDCEGYLCILNPFSNSLKTCYEIEEDVELWKQMFTKLKDQFNINSENYLLVLTSPDCFFVPDSDDDDPDPEYMSLKPMNPYTLTSEQFLEFGCPSDIHSLKVEPKSNPFAHKLSAASSIPQLKILQFAHDFVFTTKPMKQLLKSPNNTREHSQIHYKNIVNYFRHLKSRLLANFDLKDQLIDHKFDDYAAYGERFWLWLIDCKLFPVIFLRNYSILIFHYLKKFPENILKLRTQLCDVYCKIADGHPDQDPQVADTKLVDFPSYDKVSLHTDIKSGNNTDDQIDHLLNKVYLKNQSMQFADFIIEMIASDQNLAELKLSLEQADVLHGGFNVFMKDFYFYVKFGGISGKLDRTTFVMALQVIKKSISIRYELESSKMGNVSFCFKLRSTGESSKFVNLWTRGDYDVYTGDSLLLLSEYDKRFVPVVLLLRYWICLHKFNRGAPFYASQFIWLVVHFLQQTTPPVLPPLKQLMKDVKSINPNQKRPSSAELVVQFLEFCTRFNFTNRVLCPLDGTSYTKEEYCNLKGLEFYGDSSSQIENPLSGKLDFLVTESTDQFVKFVAKLLNEVKIDSENCVKILTDPSIGPSL